MAGQSKNVGHREIIIVSIEVGRCSGLRIEAVIVHMPKKFALVHVNQRAASDAHMSQLETDNERIASSASVTYPLGVPHEVGLNCVNA